MKRATCLKCERRRRPIRSEILKVLYTDTRERRGQLLEGPRFESWLEAFLCRVCKLPSPRSFDSARRPRPRRRRIRRNQPQRCKSKVPGRSGHHRHLKTLNRLTLRGVRRAVSRLPLYRVSPPYPMTFARLFPTFQPFHRAHGTFRPVDPDLICESSPRS